MSWLHADVQDNGLNYIKNNCNKLLLLKNYVNGDSYATVNGATVKVAEAALVTGDFSIAAGAGSSRVLTAAVSGKSGGNALIATTNGVDDLVGAFVDTVNSKVLWVTDEVNNQTHTVGNPVQFTNSPTLTIPQP